MSYVSDLLTYLYLRHNTHDLWPLVADRHIIDRLTVNGENKLSCRLSVVGGRAGVNGGIIGDRDTRDE